MFFFFAAISAIPPHPSLPLCLLLLILFLLWQVVGRECGRVFYIAVVEIVGASGSFRAFPEYIGVVKDLQRLTCDVDATDWLGSASTLLIAYVAKEVNQQTLFKILGCLRVFLSMEKLLQAFRILENIEMCTVISFGLM